MVTAAIRPAPASMAAPAIPSTDAAHAHLVSTATIAIKVERHRTGQFAFVSLKLS